MSLKSLVWKKANRGTTHGINPNCFLAYLFEANFASPRAEISPGAIRPISQVYDQDVAALPDDDDLPAQHWLPHTQLVARLRFIGNNRADRRNDWDLVLAWWERQFMNEDAAGKVAIESEIFPC